MSMEQTHMTVDDAAKELRMSRSNVIRLIKSGDLPATKFGREWSVSRRDAHIFACRPKTTRRGRPRTINQS